MPHISQRIDEIIASIPFFQPELVLIGGFVICILASLFTDRFYQKSSFLIFLGSLAVASLVLLKQLDAPSEGFFGMIQIDNFSVYSRLILLAAAAYSAVMIRQYNATLGNGSKQLGDLYSVLLGIVIGLNILTMSKHFLLLFIGIEMSSIGSYILVSYFSQNKTQTEAALKYVLFGAACAAVMLYGISLLYGFTGSLNFGSAEYFRGIIAAPKIISVTALVFILVGMGFKLSFVPIHLWTPDVYDGSPTPITAFLSTVPKIGAIALFARLLESWLMNPFYFGEAGLNLTILIAIATMLIGNLIALLQNDSKRMMAYSSIGHTGLLIMASFAYVRHQPEILLFNLAIYTLTNLAAFGFIQILEERIQTTSLKSYSGLGKQWPVLFTSFAIIGISLVGLPATAGFIAKLTVFTNIFDLYQTMDHWPYLLLLIAGVLTSVISLFFYFKIPKYAFLKKESPKSDSVRRFPNNPVFILGVILTIFVIILGLFPQYLFDLLGSSD